MALLSGKNNKNEYIKLSVTLFAISFVVAFLLATVNYITAPKIEQIKQNKFSQAMVQVLPDAVEFVDLTDIVKAKWERETALSAFMAAKDKEGNIIGYCVQVLPKGYSDQIDLMVGLTAEGKVADTSIISITDTPGIGTKVKDKNYQNQFVGKSGVLTAVKGIVDAPNEVALISGASRSSTGFTEGVNAALSAYSIAKEEGIM